MGSFKEEMQTITGTISNNILYNYEYLNRVYAISVSDLNETMRYSVKDAYKREIILRYNFRRNEFHTMNLHKFPPICSEVIPLKYISTPDDFKKFASLCLFEKPKLNILHDKCISI